MRGFIPALVWAVLGSLPMAAPAATVLVSQSRSVTAEAGPIEPAETDTRSAPDFGRFRATVHADFHDGFDPLEGATAEATQDSLVTTSLLRSVGHLSAGQTDAFARAESLYAVTFELTESTPYQLQAMFTTRELTSRGSALVARLRESGPEGTVVFERVLEAAGDGGTLTGAASGTLNAGKYFFEADARGFTPGGDASGADAGYSAALALGHAVPLPAAFWPGGITLALLALRSAWTRRGAARPPGSPATPRGGVC
jgi:hypothetical protein